VHAAATLYDEAVFTQVVRKIAPGVDIDLQIAAAVLAQPARNLYAADVVFGGVVVGAVVAGAVVVGAGSVQAPINPAISIRAKRPAIILILCFLVPIVLPLQCNIFQVRVLTTKPRIFTYRLISFTPPSP